MNHEAFRASYLAKQVGPEEQSHLAGCPTCQSTVPDLDATLALLGEAALWNEPGPALEDRVLAGLEVTVPYRPSRRRWVWLAAPAAATAVAVTAWLVTRPPDPDWVVDLPGVRQAAAAAGTVEGWNEESGTRLVVKVNDLASAPDGFVYEFWMSQGAKHVSAGTFRHTDDVELWAGVSRADHPRLWVTLEPLDDDPAPSRQVVLDTG